MNAIHAPAVCEHFYGRPDTAEAFEDFATTSEGYYCCPDCRDWCSWCGKYFYKENLRDVGHGLLCRGCEDMAIGELK